MIVSHRHRFIFLKTNKTAGTSVEIALSRFCGAKDIITPISRDDEETRRALGYPGSQNHLRPFHEYRLSDLWRLIRHRQRTRKYYNHMSAREAKAFLGDSVWERYFKFCLERNPWDRTISQYFWTFKSEPRPPISDFIGSDAHMNLREWGWDVYTIDGRLAVDRVLRFEDLSRDLEKVCGELGLPSPLPLPRAKSSFRKDKRHYSEILSPDDQERIGTLFADEIELCGYTF